MQALIDGKEPPSVSEKNEDVQMDDATGNSNALATAETKTGSDSSVTTTDSAKPENGSQNDLQKTLHDWIEKEIKITNFEPKSEEHLISIRNMENRLLSEVRMLTEGIVSTFQVLSHHLAN